MNTESAEQLNPAEHGTTLADPVAKTNLLDCLLYWEQTRPDAVYFTQPVAPDRVIDYSWGEVADQVRRMASHLKGLDLPPQSQIAILGKNSAHWIMADLAIWMAGHVSVPLYPTLNAETASYVLEHSEARLLFIGKMDEFWPIVEPGIPKDFPSIILPLAPDLDGAPKWEDIIARAEPLQEVPQRDPQDLATILYTSGSTGRPKGVMISFEAMIAAARGMEQLFPVTIEDRMLSYLPLAHAAERAVVQTMSLYFGFRVYFAHSLDTFVEDLRRARPTLFFSVPRLWTKFYLGICEKLSPGKQKLLFSLPLISGKVKKKILTELGLQHVRAAITGSAPLAPSLMEWYRNLGLELLEGYGMSENFAYSHGNIPGDTRIGYVGRANPGVECRIAENGEILVKSPGMMLGYFKDPEKTAQEITEDGFLKTGDMGEMDEQGRLKITGRVKELFKTSKGKYVAPVPIENRLNNHPKIEAVCVTGCDLPQPFALVMLSEDAQTELANGGDRDALGGALEGLLDQVNEQLEHHERLAFLVVVRDQWAMDNGYLTPTMKIKRNVIEDRYAAQADSWAAAREKIVWE